MLPGEGVPFVSTEDELRAVRRELARVHAALAVIHRTQRPGTARHGWLKFVIKDLETNPRTQYRVHLYGVVYWLVNFPLIVFLFFFEPVLWLKLGIFITLVYSIYANFATDYGAMSAAMAAFTGTGLPEIPAEPPEVPGPAQAGGNSK